MKIRAVIIPLLVLGTLQLSGCLPGRASIPPGGVYLSESAGAHFDQSVQIEESTDTIARFLLRRSFRAPEDPNLVFVAAGNQGLVVSENGGETWRVVPVPLAQTLDVVRLGNGAWVVSGTEADGQGHIARSLDSGKSWDSVLTVPVPINTRRFEIISQDILASVILSLERDPFNPDRVYAGSNLGTILVGEQSVKVWKTIHTLRTALTEYSGNPQSLAIRNLIPSIHRVGELIVITNNGTLIQIRGGKQTEIKIPRYVNQTTHNPFGDSLEARRVFDLSYIANFPQALLVATNVGAVVSRDDGKTWIDLNLPIDASQPFNRAIAVTSPTNPNRMLIGINNVVYRSEDSGQTWNTFNFGIDNYVITDLLIDPSNASRVLAIVQPLQS